MEENTKYGDRSIDDVWEHYKPMIELLSQVSNSFIYVGENRGDEKPRLHYISPSFVEFYNLNTEDALADSSFLLNIIHPEDLQISNEASYQYMDFMYNVPAEERMNYKMISEVRVSVPGGRYKKAIIQEQTLELTPDGIPWLLLGIADFAPNQSDTDFLRMRLVNFKTGELHPFMLGRMEEAGMLTAREKEILMLISEGRLSKEISDQLSISLNTVNRHRQNILEKLKVDNSLEAVRIARSLGLMG